MLHAFIAGAFAPNDTPKGQGVKAGCAGWAVRLYRDFGPGGGPDGRSFVLETRASGHVLGVCAENDLDHGLRMASRIASVKACDVDDGNMETLAVHLISENGKHELPLDCIDGGDPFRDCIELYTGVGQYAWAYGGGVADDALRQAQIEARDGRWSIHE